MAFYGSGFCSMVSGSLVVAGFVYVLFGGFGFNLIVLLFFKVGWVLVFVRLFYFGAC